MVVHGPATANYDEELDTIMLSDWTHQTADQLYSHAQTVGPPLLDNGLINGKNTYQGGGSRYEATFESGKSYRLRLINTAIDTHFKFAIDGHSFTVIANDFVPIVPFEATYLDITMGMNSPDFLSLGDFRTNLRRPTLRYYCQRRPGRGRLLDACCTSSRLLQQQQQR